MSSRRPRILITTRTALPPSATPPGIPPFAWQYLANSEAVQEAGGIPFYSAPDPSDDELRNLYGLADGILLCGGPDVHPSLYGESLLSGKGGYTDTAVDRADLLLATWAIADDKPVLGICRGAQLIAVASRGTLWQDIPTAFPKALSHRGKDPVTTSHEVTVAEGTKLAAVIGSGVHSVNSRHHQAVRETGELCAISATSPDGIIEGVERTDRAFVVGVQWHPEELRESSESRALFSALVEAAARHAHGELAIL